MEYPVDFPSESRAKVEATRIRAARRFDSDKSKAKWNSEIEAHFISYVLTVFLAFAKESWRLRLWPMDKTRDKCLAFLIVTRDARKPALGIEVSPLFLNTRKRRRCAVAEYPYLDELGKLLFQVQRYEPKGLAQRRPDGRGGWIGNLDGVRRVLYRLPEVLATQSVFVCEGEKDCETARTLATPPSLILYSRTEPLIAVRCEH